jgi:hypothetical protein
MRGLFGAVATNRHAAPSSRSSPRAVREDQRAVMSLARLRVGEIFFAHELRQRFADRQQQGFRGSPAPYHSQFQAIATAMVTSRYLAERFVTLQEPIQGTQFVERLGPERPARMLSNEASEPLAQRASLICNLVQFTWHRSRLQRIQCIRWNKLGLSQPLQEAIAAVEPVNRCIDWCRDGVQEIEAERVGNKNCRRSTLHDWPPSQAKSSNRITCQTALDKLCDGFITCQAPLNRLWAGGPAMSGATGWR